MKINTNAIGNYNVHKTTQSRQTRKLANAEVHFTDEPINVNEKKYFARLYPQKKEEITSHQFYQRDGKRAGVSVGSLFDMRG